MTRPSAPDPSKVTRRVGEGAWSKNNSADRIVDNVRCAVGINVRMFGGDDWTRFGPPSLCLSLKSHRKKKSSTLSVHCLPKIRITICRGTHLIAFIGIALLLGLALGVFEVRLEPAPLVTVEGAYQLTRDGREKGDGPLFTDGA